MREQHRQLGARQPLPGRLQLGELRRGRQHLLLRSISPRPPARPWVGRARAMAPRARARRERERSGRDCRQHRSLTSSVISASSALRASRVELARGDEPVEQDLDVDLVVGAVDAGRVVDRVGVDRCRRRRANSMRPRWVKPRLPPSPTTLARSSLPSTRTVSLVLSPTSACDSVARLDVGADAAVPQQVDRGAQDGRDQLGRASAR